MTEADADDIIEMLTSTWGQFMADPGKAVYRRWLMTQDAELVVTAIGKLAIFTTSMPRISEIKDMLGNVTGGKPALEAGVCPTCNDDKVVLVQTRPAEESLWMKEKGLIASGSHDETMPCPDCNSEADTDYHLLGRRYRPVSEATVREQMEPLGTDPHSPRTTEIPFWVRRWHYARHVLSPPDMRRFPEQGQHGDQSEPLMPDDAYVAEAMLLEEAAIRANPALRSMP